jgi:cytochrome c
MHSWYKFGVAGVLLVCGMPALAATPAEEATIRGGRTVANTLCIACHVVSPDQTLTPLYGERLPSFEDIANRPNLTADSLRALMASASWHNYALPQTLSPMSRISEKDRTQVIAFILSLRRPACPHDQSAPPSPECKP